MPKLLIVVNEDRFFLSHRFPVAVAAKKMGYDVVVTTKDTGSIQEIKDAGLRVIELPIDPTGMNPFKDAKTLAFLVKLYRRERPDIVHHVGMKNILWGGLAARFTGVPGVVNAVSGLGSLFNDGRVSLVSRGILTAIRFSDSRKGVRSIFQNNDDLEIFRRYKAVREHQVRFIKGSGVDLDEFANSRDPHTDKVRVIFTARMVKEKGVCDLIEAAELLRGEYEDKVQFLLCGRLADNANAISEEYMNEHCDGKYICWLGLRNDIRDLLESSNIMAFPSYYREGVPKSLIEASAIGRPIVTCDSVGCRDVVDNGVNGYLVQPRSPRELAEKLKTLIDSPELRKEMGKASRAKAEREFSIKDVIAKHLEMYDELTGCLA